MYIIIPTLDFIPISLNLNFYFYFLIFTFIPSHKLPIRTNSIFYIEA